MFDVFDQPWTLLGVAVLVLLGILTYRSVCPEKRRLWQFLIPALIAVAAFGLDFLVTTDREKVHTVVRMALTAAENEDCPALARLIAPDYADGVHRSKADLMARCQRELSGPTLAQIRKLGEQLEMFESQAQVGLSLQARFEDTSRVAREYKRSMHVRVRLYLQKQRDGTWLISRADLLEIDKIPMSWSGV